MGQIFHPSANTLAKLGVFGGIFIVIGMFGAWDLFLRSPYTTGVGQPIEQDVPFSHKHHVQQLGLDCRYCHTSVETAAFAGIPPTKTCMNCHAQIWKDAPMLQPVRDSFASGKPLNWVRVHDAPDFVYFDHSIHVNRGIGCVSCHGQVDDMPLMWKEKTLHMQWCLECHRHPEKFVRPKDKVFDMNWEPPTDVSREDFGKALVAEHQIVSETSCSVCHR
ncbi:MAG: cytochrome c3 family protein [Verrucomicrobia bacterium]|nr:cytochrome c3 family protein [Verrucomicrobiota bacterium]